ncbi:MAG: transcription elongation factor GreA [Firmicutes bacterium]|nr:transcription elongation factor GreA [Bacillota bacterium]
MKQHLLTKNALDKLEKELDGLIAKRKEISLEIKKAREFGDLSENAEYHAAREAQSLNETEILRVKGILENHELVEESADKDVINMNSKLKIKYLEDDEIETIKIVSSIESDPFEGLLSNESPIGGALLGRRSGDVLDVTTPSGVVKVEVVEILE